VLTSELSVEDFIFSAGGGFLFGAVAGYAIRQQVVSRVDCFCYFKDEYDLFRSHRFLQSEIRQDSGIIEEQEGRIIQDLANRFLN
jgi:hypothetical protein